MGLWGRQKPQEPKGVRVRRADGVETPVALEYAGRRLGIHMWQATVPQSVVAGEPFEILCDELPAYTELGVVLVAS